MCCWQWPGVRRGLGRKPRQTGISLSRARSARTCRAAEGPASGPLAPAPWRAGRRAAVEGSREPEVKADSLLRRCCRRHTRSPCSALPPDTAVFARPLPARFPPFCKSRS